MTDKVHSTPIDATSKAAYAEQGLRFALLETSDETFGSWFRGMNRGFHSPDIEAEHLPNRVEGFAHRRLVGLWDDSIADSATPVATSSSWIADLTVPGRGTIPSWAISTVTVAPTHRRRGIARNLIESELRTAAALDVPVAILTASEATIYERFGFAPAAMRADWSIDTTRARWSGPIPDGRVQLVTNEQGQDGGGHDILERALLQTPGQISFDGHLWKRLFGLPGHDNPTDRRVVRYDDADGVQQGLAIYKVESGIDHRPSTATVLYLVTATDDAYSALWRYLIELDLVGKVEAPLRRLDEPVRWQISDSRAATEDAVGDHLWLRILDVKRTLEARHYNAPGVFVLELDDPLGFADGTFLLSIDNSGRGVVKQLDDREGFADNHHLAMRISDLAAIYLGATSVATLVKAGRINEKTPAAAIAADAAFRSNVSPWLSIWF